MAVIEVRGLTKRFGQVLAVEAVSFDVERGTVTGFLGSNGAGKLTAGGTVGLEEAFLGLTRHSRQEVRR